MYAAVCYAAAVASIVLLGICGWHVWEACLPRRYRKPPLEDDICKYADGMREHYTNQPPPGGIEAAVLLAVKREVLKQYSQSASQHTIENDRKIKSRGLALKYFLVAAGAALVLLVAGFVNNKVLPTVQASHLLGHSQPPPDPPPQQSSMPSPPPPAPPPPPPPPPLPERWVERGNTPTKPRNR